MIKKLVLSLIIYPLIIVLFILHFSKECVRITSCEAKTDLAVKPLVSAESLPATTRTERKFLPGTPGQTILYIIESEQKGPVM